MEQCTRRRTARQSNGAPDLFVKGILIIVADRLVANFTVGAVSRCVRQVREQGAKLPARVEKQPA